MELLAEMAEWRGYLERCADAYELTDYPAADRVLTMIFTHYPTNDNKDHVLLKVTVLNALYRTQILAIHKMAEHVHESQLDIPLEQGSPDAIDLLHRGHGIKGRNDKNEMNFYSFATKYCHWHKAGLYPMYDQYVSKALKHLNSKIKFIRSSISIRDNLDKYDCFKQVVDQCKDELQLDWPGYKRLDQGLWVLGKILKGDADKRVADRVGAPPKRF